MTEPPFVGSSACANCRESSLGQSWCSPETLLYLGYDES